MISALLPLALAVAGPAYAAVAPTFSPPSISPIHTSTNYTGANNGSLVNSPYVTGKSFDRFIQIWLENTDYNTAASSPVFQSLAKQGVLLNGYYGVTHPSEPNYIAAACGDFFGLGDDGFYSLPSNVSSIVDLLEAKNVSWASYQENMPYDGFTGFNYTEVNYLNKSAGAYTYYVRKHNPTIIPSSVSGVASRAARHRNFNDFAVDVNASALPQWSFITPNLVNDAHDTTIDFVSSWLSYFLVPLLSNPNFNTNRTLILLTFDETETYTINNQIYTIALGGAVPSNLIGTTDSTYYTHYSSLSTVQANWGLGSLGRQDTNKVVSNVYSWVADAVGYTNNGLLGNSSSIPLTNLTGNIPGTLNAQYWQPVLAPNTSAVGAGGGAVFVSSGTNTSLVSATTVNLTALGLKDPELQSTVPFIAPALQTATGSARASGASASASAKSDASKLATPAMGVLALVAAFFL
ncbi:hypothetical protein T439DRAFT_310856 [Meredithblackwellia eburnea MCA 4105]